MDEVLTLDDDLVRCDELASLLAPCGEGVLRFLAIKDSFSSPELSVSENSSLGLISARRESRLLCGLVKLEDGVVVVGGSMVDCRINSTH